MILSTPRQLNEAAFAALVGRPCRLVTLENDPHGIPEGSTGTIEWVGPVLPGAAIEHGQDWRQIGVKWPNGRGLCLILPPDCLEVL